MLFGRARDGPREVGADEALSGQLHEVPEEFEFLDKRGLLGLGFVDRAADFERDARDGDDVANAESKGHVLCVYVGVGVGVFVCVCKGEGNDECAGSGWECRGSYSEDGCIRAGGTCSFRWEGCENYPGPGVLVFVAQDLRRETGISGCEDKFGDRSASHRETQRQVVAQCLKVHRYTVFDTVKTS